MPPADGCTWPSDMLPLCSLSYWDERVAVVWVGGVTKNDAGRRECWVESRNRRKSNEVGVSAQERRSSAAALISGQRSAGLSPRVCGGCRHPLPRFCSCGAQAKDNLDQKTTVGAEEDVI